VTAESVVQEVVDDILDAMFPAEKAASDFLSELLDNVDRIVNPKRMLFTSLYFLLLQK